MENAPIAKFSVGNVSVAVWENESKEGNSFNTVSLQRSYKVGEEWKASSSLNVNDLPKAILALQKAYEHLSLKEKDVMLADVR